MGEAEETGAHGVRMDNEGGSSSREMVAGRCAGGGPGGGEASGAEKEKKLWSRVERSWRSLSVLALRSPDWADWVRGGPPMAVSGCMGPRSWPSKEERERDREGVVT